MKIKTLPELMEELKDICIGKQSGEIAEIQVFADSASQLLLIDGEGQNYTIKLTDKEASNERN